MKRTSEILFSVIGIILFSILFVGSLILSNSIQNNSEAKELAQQFLSDENIIEVSVEQIIKFLENGLLYIGVISLICVISGIISIVLLKKNEKHNVAGKLLITTATLGAILTLFIGIPACCGYLIAGIKTIARNRKMGISA